VIKQVVWNGYIDDKNIQEEKLKVIQRKHLQSIEKKKAILNSVVY
jgi:hypothetical protein